VIIGVALLLAALPPVATSADALAPRPAETSSWEGWAGLAHTFGVVPGLGFGLGAGVSRRQGTVSFGVDLQFLPPGEATIWARELGASGVGEPLTLPESSVSTRAMGFAGTLPVCVHAGPFRACSLLFVGGLEVDNAPVLRPLVSAGIRLGAEYPEDAPARLVASLQVMGSLVGLGGAAWSTSPVQVGLNLGVAFGSPHAP
jgi:hypothetical protein